MVGRGEELEERKRKEEEKKNKKEQKKNKNKIESKKEEKTRNVSTWKQEMQQCRN